MKDELKLWAVFQAGKNIHVAPYWQPEKHDLDHGRCVCQPKAERYPDHTVFFHEVIHEC